MEIAKEVSRFIEARMAEHRIPGVSVGVLHEGEVMVQGYGVTSVDNPLPCACMKK